MVFTGDRVRVDARSLVLPSGGIPRPADKVISAGMNNLPRPPAGVFVGRRDALVLLETGLSGGGGVMMTQAVFGLGGVGKSELALQYAHSHRASYELIWWVTAEDASQVEAGLAGLAGRICPELALTATTAEAAAWAVTWLQCHAGWLLILDDVSDPGDVEPLLGQLHGGHVLLTTRRDTGWQRIAAPVRLEVLAPGPAAALITANTGTADPGDTHVAGEIAEELGFLPLALDQASAYITRGRIPLSRYLELLREHPARMYAAGATGGHAQRTIARLWDITLKAVSRADPAGVGLLRVLACYAPDAIPRRIIGGGNANAGEDEALGLLASYSMITLTADAVSMHRLVQAVILSAPDDSDSAQRPQGTAVEWLDDALPRDPDTNVAAWPFLRAFIPHAAAVAGRYAPGEEPAALARVLTGVAVFHRSQGSYQDALRLGFTALGIAQRVYSDGQPEIAAFLGNLAATYGALGRHAEALPLKERALAVAEATVGPDHPSTALRLGNLAQTYSALGRHAEALALKERALAVTEATLGPDHPSTALRLGNLAATYTALRRHAEALPLKERALAVSEATLGPEHPRTALRLGNLARTYSALGRHAEALALKERALAVTEAALGPEHPSTAVRLGNLARTYSALGRHAEALPLEERALAVIEAVLGPDHPRTAHRLGNLAATYRDLDRHAEALPLRERALVITEAALGPDHPSTAVRLGNLAASYRAVGRDEDAAALERRATKMGFE
jgi:tetratricopeptide (TPR) repeat protein